MQIIPLAALGHLQFLCYGLILHRSQHLQLSLETAAGNHLIVMRNGSHRDTIALKANTRNEGTAIASQKPRKTPVYPLIIPRYET